MMSPSVSSSLRILREKLVSYYQIQLEYEFESTGSKVRLVNGGVDGGVQIQINGLVQYV